jgi:pilus assembly protein Flp/PilA
MNSAATTFTRRATDEAGVSAIEYGLLAALIAMTILGAVTATGTSLTGLYVYWSSVVVTAL